MVCFRWLAFTYDDFIASYANVTGADTIEEPVFDTSQEVAPATSSVTPTLVSLGKCINISGLVGVKVSYISDILTTPALPTDHAIPSTSTADDIPSTVIPISITPVFGSVKKCGKSIPTPVLYDLFLDPVLRKRKTVKIRKENLGFTPILRRRIG
ncbi:hypothetical protein JTB14_029153 [Gonioctena quinquepunctata]|nr:hypothetical protein JTB14_029153 [Gonioctena quinquepunctata]